MEWLVVPSTILAFGVCIFLVCIGFSYAIEGTPLIKIEKHYHRDDKS